MPCQFSRTQIHEGLIDEVEQCLCCDRDEITPEATFFSDLGGESIDLLELSFQIKQRFGIESNFPKLLESLEMDSSGRISPNSAIRLRERIPQIDWLTRISQVPPNHPQDLLTINLIAEITFFSQQVSAGLETKATIDDDHI